MASRSAPKKLLLCVKIIEEQFGSEVSSVAQYLIHHERNTLADITQHFAQNGNKLGLNEIRNALLVLLQHNCLELSRPASTLKDETMRDEDDFSKGLEYRINVGMVTNRIRFPQLLSVISRNYGDVGVMIMTEIIHHGRIAAEDIISAVVEKSEVLAIGLQDSGTLSRDEVQGVLEELIERRLVVTAPALEVLVSRTEVQESTNSLMGSALSADATATASSSNPRKRKQPSNSGSSATDEPPVSVRRRTAASTERKQEELPLELRIMLEKEKQDGVVEESSNGKAPGRSVRTERSTRGRGRGRGRGGKMKPDDADTPSEETSERQTFSQGNPSSTLEGPRAGVLWMVGWEQLTREQRHQLCISVARQRMGNLASRIVRIILKRSMPTEVGITSHSAGMGLLDVIQALKDEDGGKAEGLDMHTVRRVMELMRCDALGIVDKAPGVDSRDQGARYMVSIADVVKAVRGRLIHDIAVEKFGKESARIVELLQRHKYLEQQKLSEMVILPARGGRERLYVLYKHHWVEYLEVSKRGDYNPGSTYFFWTLNEQKMQASLVDNMYGVVCNLRSRRDAEYSQGKDVIEFAHTISDAKEAEKFDKLQETLERLDNAIIRVYENITVIETL
mmetsp:Transcript_12069/g.18234  ORF Transcript_12069/g.18234 Transcript_12069/m.18234 type:complete len:622 (+) Transcript_12069:48-1913(+)